MLDRLTVEHWRPYLGQVFQTSIGTDNMLGLKLADVTTLGADGGQGRQPYSLVFTGPLTPLLPQAIYPLWNESLGELGIFLVPIGPKGQSLQYEAIFT